MENVLGITKEDIDSFEDDAQASNVYSDKIAQLTAEDVETLLDQDEDGSWKIRAQKIAMLPGLDNNVKIACMILGVENVLGQLFLIHGAAEGLGAQEALHAYSVFCEAVGIPTSQTTSWVAFYFFCGVLGNQAPAGEIKNLAGMFAPGQVEIGPMAKILSAYSAPALELLMESLGVLQPLVEAHGIEFGEDEGLLDAVADRRLARLEAMSEGVIDISALAPDKAAQTT